MYNVKRDIYLFSNVLYMVLLKYVTVMTLMTIRKTHCGLLRLQQNPEQKNLEH